MNPTIENLNDPEWWSQYAPESATHWGEDNQWYKITIDDPRTRIWTNSSYGWTLLDYPISTSLHKRPNHSVESDDMVGEKHDTGKPKMSELYPKYYKDFSGIDHVDVYVVHDRFQINDPSGCIQHASKKLLLCGVRTGGKDMATEIREARDTLTRKLQLMGVE